MPSTSKSWLVLVMTVVYDVGHPWRISCMHYKVVTGVVPRQVSRDSNRLKEAWNERRRSHGPPSQNLCPAGVPSKDRTDITRGTLQALRHIKARGFYQTSTPYGFHSIPLGRNVHSWAFSYPLIPISASTSVLARFAFPSPFHVRSMSASSMCGPALLPHHHDRRAWLLQITQITLSDL